MKGELRCDRPQALALMAQSYWPLVIEHRKQKPNLMVGLLLEGCLTMTYFRTGNLHYHRRTAVSRSCSRWEGVVPTGCGRQALSVGDRTDVACDVASVHRKGRSKAGLDCANTVTRAQCSQLWGQAARAISIG